MTEYRAAYELTAAEERSLKFAVLLTTQRMRIVAVPVIWVAVLLLWLVIDYPDAQPIEILLVGAAIGASVQLAGQWTRFLRPIVRSGSRSDHGPLSYALTFTGEGLSVAVECPTAGVRNTGTAFIPWSAYRRMWVTRRWLFLKGPDAGTFGAPLKELDPAVLALARECLAAHNPDQADPFDDKPRSGGYWGDSPPQ